MLAVVKNRAKGGDLFRRLSEKGPFSEEAGKKLFKQVLEGVEYLHSHNVTHRDLKVCCSNHHWFLLNSKTLIHFFCFGV